MTEQEKDLKMSVFDIFASTQETFDEAKKKRNEESKTRINYLRFKNDGVYTIRILPLAPSFDATGRPLPMERKGYEYPLRTLTLTITNNNGKPKVIYVVVCNAKHAFKDRLNADLIDTYVNRVCDLHADDEALCKKLRESSFDGGLRWDLKRCMYAIDLDNAGEGIQILQLSNPQYKELEERKLNIWAKLNKDGQTTLCPISSFKNAYPVEITRKTVNNKAGYSFTIDTLSGTSELSEDVLQKLLDMPRLPETLYRYTRYHLEATIAFLNQLDERYGIDVMRDAEVQDCIEQIKCLLPADDQSHFTLGHKNLNGVGVADTIETLDSLWERYNRLEEAGLDDKSVEGQDLRASIKEYIESNDLEVRINHTKSNSDLLQEIEAFEEGGSRVEIVKENFEDEYDESEPAMLEPTTNNEREHNDDTNEPALRVRREGRPMRRR